MPSKNFALVVSAFLVAGLTIFTATKIVPQAKQKRELTAKQQEIINSVLKDSDNDGLKDWEEILWKTSPNNQDTDNDGTKDGDEIKANRNPLLAGPNDDLSKEDLAKITGDQGFLDPKANQTDLVAASIFNKYAEAKVQSGGIVPEDTLKDIAGIFTAEAIKNATTSTAVLAEKDIKISSQNSNASIKDYGNKIGSIIINFATERMELKNQPQAQDVTEGQLTEILLIVSQQKDLLIKTVDQLKNIFVPSSYVDVHLKILNSFNIMATASTEIEKVVDDPIKAIGNIKIFQDEQNVVGQELSDLADKLKIDGIIFNNEETGAALFVF